MTMMHRAAGAGAVGKTRQGAVPARGVVTKEGLLGVAEGLWRGVLGEGAAFPCAGLSVQVGGFEEREGGNRGIAGFLVKRQVAEVVGEESRGAKRRRGEDEEEEGEGGLEEESLALPQILPPSAPLVEPGSSSNDQPPPPALPPSTTTPSPPSPPSPPKETYTYTCPHCATPIPLQDQAEHEDWHFAKSLAEQDKAAARERIAASRASPPPPPPPPPSKKGPKKKGGGGGGSGGLEKGQRRLAFGKS